MPDQTILEIKVFGVTHAPPISTSSVADSALDVKNIRICIA